MNDGLEDIRSLSRAFAKAELRPNTERWDAERSFDDDVVPKLGELGFMGMLVSEKDGGMGFDPRYLAATLEEFAWGEPAIAAVVAQTTLAADVITTYGTPEQRAKWLDGIAAGDLVGCVAYGEEPGAIETYATRERGGWQLDGRKRYVVNGDLAHLAIVLARTDEGNALFAVPRERGINITARAETMGMRAVALVDYVIDARLEEIHYLGPVREDPLGAGDRLGRMAIAAMAVGIAQAALEHSLRYSREREQFGRPIRSFEGIRNKLADMAVRTAAARGLVERSAAALHDAPLAAMARLAAADCAMYAATEAVQIFGGYGYMRDYPVEKLMRDAKAMQLMHGTEDALRETVADAIEDERVQP